MPYEVRPVEDIRQCRALRLSAEVTSLIERGHPKATDIKAIIAYDSEDVARRQEQKPTVCSAMIALSLHMLDSLKFHRQAYSHMQDM
jgi:hypothetical protein